MHFIGQIFTKIFDVLVLPFGGGFHSLVLIVLSALTGVGMIFLFKVVSNQEAVKASRDKFKARILEMRIYQDDIVLIHKALWGALATNLTYLRVSLVPIVILIACVVPVFIQLDERFGRRHLEPGEKILLTASLSRGVNWRDLSLELLPSEGLAVDSRPVRVKSDYKVHWRLRVDEPGMHHVDIDVNGSTYRLPVHAEPSNSPIGHTRGTSHWWNPFIFPALPMIPDASEMDWVSLYYPSAEYPLIIWQTHWLWVFVFYSLVAALVFKFIFRIEV